MGCAHQMLNDCHEGAMVTAMVDARGNDSDGGRGNGRRAEEEPLERRERASLGLGVELPLLCDADVGEHRPPAPLEQDVARLGRFLEGS